MLMGMSSIISITNHIVSLRTRIEFILFNRMGRWREGGFFAFLVLVVVVVVVITIIVFITMIVFIRSGVLSGLLKA
jgi:hypothetical protein